VVAESCFGAGVLGILIGANGKEDVEDTDRDRLDVVEKEKKANWRMLG
jgi:hypothetical protein